jgi:VanZ family protein
MLIIFSLSSDTISSQHSSRLIGPIVHWLFPNMPPKNVEGIVFLVRKCAHGTEYAIFAVFVWCARNKPAGNNLRSWRWSEARLVVLLAMLYAATDELHQAFVPNRQSSVVDVLIDTLGAVLGLILLRGFGRWRKYW